MATLLTAASAISLAAPPRLVGQLIGNDEAIEAAFKKAVECEAPAGDPVRYQGTLGGASFKFVAVNCAFIGGNALWAAFMVGFHDGKRLTRVMAFKGGLSVESAVSVRGDRIVYEAKISKPNDARCCPSGKAVVEIDTSQLVALAKPVGFAAKLDPVRGRLLK